MCTVDRFLRAFWAAVVVAAPAVAVTVCSIDILGGGGAGRRGVFDGLDDNGRFSGDSPMTP